MKKLLGLMGSSRGEAPLTGEVFRDRFATAIDPITSPRAAEDGPGTWTVTGSLAKIVAGALRGLVQPTAPAWGSSRLKHTTGLTRQDGRVLLALVIPEDRDAELAVGWATGVVADPTTDGHSYLNDGGKLSVATPALKVAYDTETHELRTVELLIGVGLRATGAFYFLSAPTAMTAITAATADDPIGIPAYPSARLLWVDDAATTTPMYPVISALDQVDTVNPYYNGHFVDDVRVIDVTSWQSDSAIAVGYDRLARANAAALGTADDGTSWTKSASSFWDIVSNQIALHTLSGFSFVVKPSGLTGDGIWSWRWTTGASANTAMGFVVRWVDANNFIRVYNNGAAQIVIQSWISGGFGEQIGSASTSFTWAANTTYRFMLITKGTKYKLFIDGLDVFGGWMIDANNRVLTGSQMGPYAGATNANARWDDIFAYPNTFTLPAQLQTGTVSHQFTAGATVVSDGFSGSDSAAISGRTPDTTGAMTWAISGSGWEINTNRARNTNTNTADNARFAIIDASIADAEVQVDVRTPAVSGAGANYRGGLALRYTSSSDHVYVRTFLDDSGQLNNDEVEIGEVQGGTSRTVHKQNIGNYYATSTAYTLKCQIVGQVLHVFLAGELILSYVLANTYTGTKFGLYHNDADDGSSFDNFLCKSAS